MNFRVRRASGVSVVANYCTTAEIRFFRLAVDNKVSVRQQTDDRRQTDGR